MQVQRQIEYVALSVKQGSQISDMRLHNFRGRRLRGAQASWGGRGWHRLQGAQAKWRREGEGQAGGGAGKHVGGRGPKWRTELPTHWRTELPTHWLTDASRLTLIGL